MTEHNWPEEGVGDEFGEREQGFMEAGQSHLAPAAERHVHHEHFIERERARVFDDPRELRAWCVSSAISTKSNTFGVKDDELAEAAEKIIEVAKVYEAYINGGANG